MAAPPDFIAGATLTALQMNQIGMWKIKVASVGFGVSSVSLSDAFSSDYEHYRIIYTGGTASVDNDLKLTLGATATGYYAGFAYVPYASGAITSISNNNATSWAYAGSARPNGTSLDVDLFNPQLALRTGMTSRYFGMSTVGVGGNSSGFLDNATSYTGFTITCTSGTISGGTIRVYGYRK